MKLRLPHIPYRADQPLFHAIILIIVGLLVYGNSFSVPFVFDDIQNIVENPLIKDIHTFTDPAVLLGNRPIGYLSFAINHQLHGLNVTGYHIVNLFIHILNSLLLFLLVVSLYKTPCFDRYRSSVTEGSIRFAACAASLAFLCHPVQTGAVTYIVQRFTLLATLFYLASVVLYLTARRLSVPAGFDTLRCAAAYAASLLCALVSMKCKEIAFTLPILIIVAEFLLFDSRMRARITLLLPFIATMAVIPVSMFVTTGQPGELLQQFQQTVTISRLDYLLTQVRVVVTYLRLLVMPTGQTIDYDYPVFHSLFQLPVVISLAVHLSILAAAIVLVRISRRSLPHLRLVSFGIFWFYLTLMVESSVIPLDDIIFEHRIYLPSVGFFLICAVAGSMVETDLRQRIRFPNGIRIIFGAAVIALAIAAHLRNNVWRSSLSLWQDAVHKSPLKSRPHYNLGYYLASSGDLNSAVGEFQTAIRLDPNNSKARNNLGTVYVNKGDIDAAIREFREAVIVDRTNTTAHFNLGYILAQQGQPLAAINEFQKVLLIDPNNQAAKDQLNNLNRLMQGGTSH